MTKPSEDFEAAAHLSHVRPLGTLREKIASNTAALIVIDMQNDFCAAGGMMSKEGFDVSEAQKMASRLPGGSPPS